MARVFPVLDLGCGLNKFPGSIGVDYNARTNADVIADLNHFPYPFRDSSFREVRVTHVIEHVGDILGVMEEVHRVLTPGGLAIVVTPHHTDISSYGDSTHRWHLNSFALRHLGDDHGSFDYYTDRRFEEVATHVRLLRFWRLLGFEAFANSSRRARRFWESYLCYVVRGKVIEWRLRALKPQAK